MPFIKRFELEFSPVKREVRSPAPYSHTVKIGHLRGSSKTWYAKEIEKSDFAACEILSQEFLRIIIPSQPETRLLVNVFGIYYILSEEVRGFKPLPEGEQEAFNSGQYRGLGQVLLTSMFLEENDLKNGNIGLDRANIVRKIDGDWCFSSKDNPSSVITTECIENLPKPRDFDAYQWLDFNIYGQTNFNPSRLVHADALSKRRHFRNEINEAIFKISLLPKAFIEDFVDAYIPAAADWFIDKLIERQRQLYVAALSSASYIDFILNNITDKMIYNFIKHLTNFKANGSDSPLVMDDDSISLNNAVLAHAKRLKKHAVNLKSSVKKEIIELLKAIEHQRLDEQDVLVLEFSKRQLARIHDASFSDLSFILKEVKKVHDVLYSESYQSIVQFLNSSPLPPQRQSRLLKAIHQTPLLDRAFLKKYDNPVLAGIEALLVEEALEEMATHKAHKDDLLLFQFISEQRQALANSVSVKDVKKIKHAVYSLLPKVDISAVKKEAIDLEFNSTQVRRLQRAIKKVPLEKRYLLLQGDNPVMASLKTSKVDKKLDELQKNKVDDGDYLLMDYIHHTRNQLNNVQTELEVLDIQREVQELVYYSDIKSVLKYARTLSLNSHDRKHLKNLLHSVPIKERRHILNGENPVVVFLKAKKVEKSLTKLKSLSISPRDTLLNELVGNLKHRLYHAKTTKEIAEIDELVQTGIHSMQSEEVKAVQDKIALLRKSSKLTTFSRSRKADLIEKALMNTPVFKRATVISERGENPVKEALASIRRFRHCVVPKKDGHIDMERASTMLRELQFKFDEATPNVTPSVKKQNQIAPK